MRQAKDADILPGDWHIPAGTILLLSMGPMMRYDDVIIIVIMVIVPSHFAGSQVW